MRILWVILGVVTLGSACRIPFISVDPTAAAQLKDAGGRTVGHAVFVQDNGSVRVIIDVVGLPPGQKAVRLHAVGRCEPPSFESAGAPSSPAAAQPASANPRRAQVGALPTNIAVDSAGRGHLEATLRNVSVDPGPRSLLDADGSAVVVYANPDTASAARIACGEIRRGN